jgi:hypothetical protein
VKLGPHRAGFRIDALHRHLRPRREVVDRDPRHPRALEAAFPSLAQRGERDLFLNVTQGVVAGVAVRL